MDQIDLVEKSILLGGFGAVMVLFKGMDSSLLEDFLSEDEMNMLKLAVQAIETLQEKLYSEIEESVKQ